MFVAGQIAFDATGKLVGSDVVTQTRQALHNVVTVLAAGNARPAHVTRMTWYVKDKRDYLAQAPRIGEIYREYMGRHYPAMTLIQVADLLEQGALIEIEATAVVPKE